MPFCNQSQASFKTIYPSKAKLDLNTGKVYCSRCGLWPSVSLARSSASVCWFLAASEAHVDLDVGMCGLRTQEEY